MKSIIAIIALCMLVGFSSCGKKGNETTTQKQDKKTEATQQPQAKTFFTVSEVDKSPSKGVLPAFAWDENGKKSSIKDFDGKVIFINLWATWCGPCKKEIPDLMAISNELKDKNFKMLGIQVLQQPNAQSLEDYLKTNPISYLILDGNQELFNALETAADVKIEGIPFTIIVDKSGRIVEKIIGARSKDEYLTKINKYL